MKRKKWKILVFCSLIICFIGIILIVLGHEPFLPFIYFALLFSLTLTYSSINFLEWRKLKRTIRKPVSTSLSKEEAYDELLAYFSEKHPTRNWTILHSSKHSQISVKTSVEMARLEKLFPSKLTIYINSLNKGSEIELKFSQKTLHVFVAIIVTLLAFTLLSDLLVILNSIEIIHPFFYLWWVTRIVFIVVLFQSPFERKNAQRRYFRAKILKVLLKEERKRSSVRHS